MKLFSSFSQHRGSLIWRLLEKMKASMCIFFPGVLIFILSGCNNDSISPIKYVHAVANRIIADASFDLEPVTQNPLAFPCIVDATPFASVQETGVVKASGTIYVEENGIYRFGFMADTEYTVYINGEKVFHLEENGVAFPNEVAYGIYEFTNYKTIKLKAQKNHFTVEGNGKISFGALDDAGFAVNGVKYNIEKYFDKKGKVHRPPVYTQMRIHIPEYSAFQKHAYTEWHYANGTTMFGLLSLGDYTGDLKYEAFVKSYCLFTLENEPLFSRQYYEQNSLKTQNYRMFRCSMLDDSSAPALPFIELYLHGFKPAGMITLLTRIENFVMNIQPRLPDGTFVRPEPKWTIWADDLFMSSLFLLRYGETTGESRYYDEVANQIIHYDQYLFDVKSKLYHHGRNETMDEPLGQFWGRANGWVVWAVSEALLYLPDSHPQYKTILDIHQRQLKNLAEYQDINGMWHQVLNMPDSYEETSCTAIFTMSMARAVRMGWIDQSYRKNALRGWRAIERMIDIKTGVVSGICESTPIGSDLDFYLNRGTKPNDPRGVGSVITAGVEIVRLMNE